MRFSTKHSKKATKAAVNCTQSSVYPIDNTDGTVATGEISREYPKMKINESITETDVDGKKQTNHLVEIVCDGNKPRTTPDLKTINYILQQGFGKFLPKNKYPSFAMKTDPNAKRWVTLKYVPRIKKIVYSENDSNRKFGDDVLFLLAETDSDDSSDDEDDEDDLIDCDSTEDADEDGDEGEAEDDSINCDSTEDNEDAEDSSEEVDPNDDISMTYYLLTHMSENNEQ